MITLMFSIKVSKFNVGSRFEKMRVHREYSTARAVSEIRLLSGHNVYLIVSVMCTTQLNILDVNDSN